MDEAREILEGEMTLGTLAYNSICCYLPLSFVKQHASNALYKAVSYNYTLPRIPLAERFGRYTKNKEELETIFIHHI